MANNNDIKEKLGKLLTTIFQFDTEDLDFGIYKILNFKKKEIAEFINKDLIEEINKQLKLIGSEEQKKQQAELEKLKNQLIDLGIEDYEKNPKYQEKKKQLENIKISQELEKQIYNYIYAFFSRYYDRGDFISKRRYGKNEKYAIPYNGEETLLYWANNDQYYVKTTESFKKFSFKISGLKVNFRVVEAEEDNGNVKAEENRYFIVSSEKVYDIEKNELNIYFEFRALTDVEEKKYPKPNQEQINEDNIKAIQKALEKESKAKELFEEDEKGKTPLSKNLNKYTRENTSDYFIHKDLKGFLERELDFFIKNEVVDLSDVTQLDVEHFNRYVLEVKVLRSICNKIIDFLAQIENFQKKLWEKKKFVLKTDYVISIDRLPEEFHDEIIKNKEQIAEWKELFGIEVKSKKDLIANNTLNGAELKKLPIDSKYFAQEFKERLLEKLTEKSELSGLMDGVLINSENYHALSLLFEKYKGKVKCIYIDPPYNTGSDEFLYKDKYMHSSWLSMMKNRFELCKEFLKDNGVIFVSCDDNELFHLKKLLDYVFSDENYLNTISVKSKVSAGASGGGEDRRLKKNIEYILCYARENFGRFKDIYKETELMRYIQEMGDSGKSFKYVSVLYHIGEKKYFKTIKDGSGNDIIIYKVNEYEIKNVNQIAKDENLSLEEVYDKYFDKILATTNAQTSIRDRVWEVTGDKDELYSIDYIPISGRNKGKKTELYFLGKQKVLIIWLKNTAVRKKNKLYKKEKIGTFWEGFSWINVTKEGKIKFEYGKKPEEMVERIIEMSTNKADIVLDFFAGSSTTCAVSHKMNRKWIGVELESYFESKTKPRMVNVIVGEEGGISKKFNWNGGGLFVYFKIEQYEDALENIEFSQKKLSEFSDYFVRYMLDFETRDSVTFLNIDKMENPFNYKINVMEDYQQKAVSIDLVETYNYLIGLEVSKFKTFQNKDDNNRKYVVVEGKRENRPVIVIWRDITKFSPEKDREFIQKNILKDKFDEIHINGDNLIKDSVLIEEQFKRLMNGS